MLPSTSSSVGASNISRKQMAFGPLRRALMQRHASTRADGAEDMDGGQWIEEVEDDETEQILGIVHARADSAKSLLHSTCFRNHTDTRFCRKVTKRKGKSDLSSA